MVEFHVKHAERKEADSTWNICLNSNNVRLSMAKPVKSVLCTKIKTERKDIHSK
jgi:hypothetical protein